MRRVILNAARVLGLAFGLLALAACRDQSRPVYLDIATTTSVKNSGVLDELLRPFQQESGIIVRAHAAGSGRALEMMADGIVDLVLTHAPRLETKYLATHATWVYRKIAFNRFVIVGPPHDPAGVRGAPNAVEAFRRIARADVNFISRHDESGTHERESRMWEDAGRRPDTDNLVVSAGSMATALRHTEERVGYTLSDEATFRQFESSLELAALYADDDALLNTYAVVYSRGAATARRFAEWLTAGRGRQRLAAYEVNGVPVFHPWPDGCRDDTPAAQLCPP